MFKKILRAILKFFCVAFFKIPFRIKVKGKENLPEGGYVLCPNHKTTLDAVFLVGITDRNVHYMAKENIWKYLWGKTIAYAFDMIPTKRNGKDINAIKEAYSVLSKGEPLGIFPEGTRNGIKKGIELKTGAVFLALKKNVPIVPVGISGKLKIFGRGNSISFGKPIDFSQYIDKKDIKNEEELIRLTKILEQKILEQVDENEYKEYRLSNEEVLKLMESRS